MLEPGSDVAGSAFRHGSTEYLSPHVIILSFQSFTAPKRGCSASLYGRERGSAQLTYVLSWAPNVFLTHIPPLIDVCRSDNISHLLVALVRECRAFRASRFYVPRYES